MLRFTQEPSSGSSPVLSLKLPIWFFSLLVCVDAVIVMVAYRPVVQACGEPHACTTGQYATITLTASTQTSKEKNHIGSFKLSTGLLPDDGSCVNRNMSEQVL